LSENSRRNAEWPNQVIFMRAYSWDKASL
jgi:hypothetical protein